MFSSFLVLVFSLGIFILFLVSLGTFGNIKNLIESMYRNGAMKKNLKAKIFGGGNVIDLNRPQGPVAEGNIRLARIMVELEDIPIVHAYSSNQRRHYKPHTFL